MKSDGNFLLKQHLTFKTFKGVVHFKKKTFADNLLTPMTSKMPKKRKRN